jgi:hypothetical protein
MATKVANESSSKHRAANTSRLRVSEFTIPNTMQHRRSRRPSKRLDAFCRRQFAADCVIGTFGFDFRQRQLSFAERGLSDRRPFPFGRLKPLHALIINPIARALLASAERNEQRSGRAASPRFALKCATLSRPSRQRISASILLPFSWSLSSRLFSSQAISWRPTSWEALFWLRSFWQVWISIFLQSPSWQLSF